MYSEILAKCQDWFKKYKSENKWFKKYCSDNYEFTNIDDLEKSLKEKDTAIYFFREFMIPHILLTFDEYTVCQDNKNIQKSINYMNEILLLLVELNV